MNQDTHVPVLTNECMEYLAPKPGGVFVDASFGCGGHFREIHSRIMPGGILIGIDRDLEAISAGARNFQDESVHLFCANYSDMARILTDLNIAGVNGIICDLGLSSYQLEHSGRGFSFLRDEPLNMRMDGASSGLTAEDLVNTAAEEELAFIFREHGEEPHARAVARAIIKERQKNRIVSSLALGDLIRRVKRPFVHGRERIHPATQCFQALRITVNDELVHLARFLEVFPDYLLPGGRIAIIAFHSLEARMVKNRFRELAKGCICPPDMPCTCGLSPRGRLITRKAVKPSEEEVARNPRSRSARLRVFESF
jgi:16S rRNA (cytosine1402-N4)-methyltransferase